MTPTSAPVLRRAAQTASVLAILSYVALALIRLRHPFPLEQLEGGAGEEVRRLLAGKAIYPAPSVDFISYAYPPLYFWLSGLVGLITGPGLLPLRAVSVAASFGTLGILWCRGGIAAAGVFAAANAATGNFYDIGRVDSLYVFLLLSFFVVADRATSMRVGAAAGGLLFLAAMTKQTAIVAAAPVLGYLLFKRPRIALMTGAAFGLPWLGLSLLLNATSGGWYRYATIDIFNGHDVAWKHLSGFWVYDLLPELLPALVVGVILVRRHPLLALAGLGAIGSAWVSRLHSGGAINVLMPVAAILALMVGLGTTRWRRVGFAVVLVQLALLVVQASISGLPVLPDADLHRQLVASISSMPGEVLVLDEPSDAVLAGKRGSAHSAAVIDVLRGKDERAKQLLLDSIATDVRRSRWSAIVFVRSRDRDGFPADFEQYYKRDPRRGPGNWWIPRSAVMLPPPASD